MAKLNLQEAIRLYNNGDSLRIIAEKLIVNPATISIAFKKAGVITRPPPTIGTKITQNEIQKLIDSGKTIAEIARQEHVSVVIIKRILNGKTKDRSNDIVQVPDSIKTLISREYLSELLKSGLNDQEIATKLGYSRETINQLRLSYNLPPSNKGRIVLDTKLKDYVDNETSDSDISNITGWSLSTVKCHRQQLNLHKKQLWEQVNLTQELKSVIAGIMLGDASISKSIGNIKPHLEYGHAADQGEYVRLVYVLLNGLLHDRAITVKAPSQNHNEDVFYRFRTIQHPWFQELRKKCYQENFYPDGKALKRITTSIINNLSEISLVLWYMDDGFVNDYNNKDEVGFCAEGFHRDDLIILIKHLKDKFNLDTYINYSSNLLTGHKLLIHETSIERFENLISKYIIKCMRHKFPKQYVVPPWEDNPEYMSEWDLLCQKAPLLPPPRCAEYVPKYSNTRTISTNNGNIAYTVLDTTRIDIAEFLQQHHYLGRPPHHAKYYMKLIQDNVLVGAAAFSSLRSKDVIGSIFNTWVSYKDGLDVARFACLDSCPKNTESFFLSECMKVIKTLYPNIKFLVTYSQPEMGHFGYVYQATNWIYVSNVAGGKVKYLVDGKTKTRKTLKRIHGQNTGRKEWREIYKNRLEIRNLPAKHKYIFILDETLNKYLNIPYIPYPKKDE